MVATLVAVAALTGCGGLEDEAPIQARTVTQPEPAVQGALGRYVRRLGEAAGRERCGAVAALVHSSSAPQDAERCRAVHSRLQGWHDPEAEQYGTGALVNFQAERDQLRTAVLAMDRNRAFRLLFVVDSPIGSQSGPARADYDRAARQAAAALAFRDCARFLAVAHRSVGVANGPDSVVCRALPTLGVARILQAHPSTRPQPLGGDGRFAFYGLPADDDAYYTMVMAREPIVGTDDGSTAAPRFVTAVPSG